MTDITKIPFHGTTIVATEIDGVPHVAVKPVCEAIGLDYSAQYRRIHRQPWATVAMMTTVGADGKNRGVRPDHSHTKKDRHSLILSDGQMKGKHYA